MKIKLLIKIVLITFLLLGVTFFVLNISSRESKAQPKANVEGTWHYDDGGEPYCTGVPLNCSNS